MPAAGGGSRALLSEVAHELRTPLTTIEASMEGLLNGVIEPTPETFAGVADEAARLRRVVSDLGLLSRADEGALSLDLVDVDLAELATKVTERLRPQFDDKEVRLEVHSAGLTRASRGLGAG